MASDNMTSDTSSHDDHHHEAPEGVEFSVEVADQEIFDSIESGIQDENLPYGKLGMWITIGLVAVISLVIFAMQLSDYSEFQRDMAAAGETENLQVTKLLAEQDEALNSFGVVDAEKGIYSVPIDSAISLIVNE